MKILYLKSLFTNTLIENINKTRLNKEKNNLDNTLINYYDLSWRTLGDVEKFFYLILI